MCGVAKMFRCPKCRKLFSLTPAPRETQEQFARRITEQAEAACPQCGIKTKRCKKRGV